MPFKINHIHIKSPDPRKTAEWYEIAFGFKIISDETRVFGDRFVRCNSGDGGMLVSISNARTGETLGPANANAHYGLEHFAVECDDIDADIARLDKLGARLQEGPLQTPNGVRFAFIGAPDGARIELIEMPKKSAG
jgi:catechol 2,3-dioxygenase-like lactoylglutathione lyase family enzyme